LTPNFSIRRKENEKLGNRKQLHVIFIAKVHAQSWRINNGVHARNEFNRNARLWAAQKNYSKSKRDSGGDANNCQTTKQW
jgi:hypothetical protein